MQRSTTSCVLILAAAFSLHGQNQKEMTLQLQRDVTLLQEQLRTMQRTQDEKFAAISESLRNTLDLVNRLNATLAVTQANMNDKLGEINKQVASPLATVGSKVDSMADQFQGLSNTIADLNSRLGKLDAKVVELQKMVQASSTPVVAPPPASGSTTPTPPAGAASVPPAEKIYNDAQRDFSAGSYDLALQGFQEYVKNYATTQLAADAQFYIGEIFSRREDFDGAIKEYDRVIEQYADSSRVPNARFMKGIALMKLGKRSDAKREFQTVVDKYPGNELAPRAKQYLKALGVNTTQAPAPVTKKATVRRR